MTILFMVKCFLPEKSTGKFDDYFFFIFQAKYWFKWDLTIKNMTQPKNLGHFCNALDPKIRKMPGLIWISDIWIWPTQHNQTTLNQNGPLCIQHCRRLIDERGGQNLHWKLGQQTPSVGTLLTYLETTV